MSPPESPIHDPLEGELTKPPPSDLSEYTWEDSETEIFEPGRDGQSLPASVRGSRPAGRSDRRGAQPVRGRPDPEPPRGGFRDPRRPGESRR